MSLKFKLHSLLPILALAAIAFLASGSVAKAQQTTVLVLAAEDVVLEERYPAPGELPNAEKNYAVTPASAVREWVRTSLRADGTPGIAKLILLDGRIVQQSLKTKGGIKGFFTDDQEYRYEGRLHLRIEYQPAAPGQASGFAEAKETLFFTIAEDATLAQREAQVTAMVQNLMQRAALQLENNIRKHIPGLIH